MSPRKRRRGKMDTVKTAKMTLFIEEKNGRTIYKVKREGDAGFVLSTGNEKRARDYAGRSTLLALSAVPLLWGEGVGMHLRTGRPVRG
jgi:hypothetical protein